MSCPPVKTMASWDWESCGLASDPVQIRSIAVAPDPPKPGENMTVSVQATAQEDVAEGAYANVEVKLGLIRILQKEFNLCEEARKANMTVQCPVEKGDRILEKTVKLPDFIPPGPIKINVNGYTTDDEPLLCINLNVNFANLKTASRAV
ncbi:uncharacterized protein STEHIDRAFT_66199 [Stereum hirsutum FP-91666 SS1]|uniref:uncharacterized protein n=1 Tax=Stereum hirsutum (strain FP-91666) TaxID=721885 RepID=UPI0004449ECF|nr:uncharacterized protein STEHIDRAFT_66199 [Stereum hirsutum FP-91666 SS1]EIM81574.1 hypothetical protein STEHIDRAFT_66199 [Stereum hirsutum FP-91666 SS1]